jgi:hypothetical protein
MYSWGSIIRGTGPAVDAIDKLAASIAATIPYVGGPMCGKVEFVIGSVHFRRCYYDTVEPHRIHVYELSRDYAGRAVYLWLRVESEE